MSASEVANESTQPPPLSRSGSMPKPKGILKNAPHPPASPQQGPRLQWDEENLAATEIQKDSLMKITEPKTPFVRYNAETDTFEGDIPSLDLYAGQTASPQPQSPTNADSSGPSSRRTSFSSARPSVSGRSGSGSSSRSTSFNLPSDARREIRSQSAQSDRGGEVEEEEMDEETQAKHDAFLKARGRHYSNEAQAMKLAAKLMAEEDDDEETAETDSKADTASEDVSMEDSGTDEVPSRPRVNGRY